MNASATRNFLKEAIKESGILLFSRKDCPQCQRVESLFLSYRTKPKIIHVDERHDMLSIQEILKKWTGDRELPKLFLGGTYFGDKTEIENLHREGVLADLVQKASACTENSVKAR